jgi:hypothetical protein
MNEANQGTYPELPPIGPTNPPSLESGTGPGPGESGTGSGPIESGTSYSNIGTPPPSSEHTPSMAPKSSSPDSVISKFGPDVQDVPRDSSDYEHAKGVMSDRQKFLGKGWEDKV